MHFALACHIISAFSMERLDNEEAPQQFCQTEARSCRGSIVSVLYSAGVPARHLTKPIFRALELPGSIDDGRPIGEFC